MNVSDPDWFIFVSAIAVVGGGWLAWITRTYSTRSDLRAVRERVVTLEATVSKQLDQIEKKIEELISHHQKQADRIINNTATLVKMVDDRVTKLLTEDHTPRSQYHELRTLSDRNTNRITRLEAIIDRFGLKS